MNVMIKTILCFLLHKGNSFPRFLFFCYEYLTIAVMQGCV